MTASVATVDRGRRKALTAFTSSWASQIGVTVAFFGLWLAFIVFAPTTFTGERIYLSFAQTTPYFAIVALFVTMVVIAGDIDLSVGSEMGLAMVGFTLTWHATGSVELGILAALGSGALCGVFNGVLVTFVGIPSLVVTLGTQFFFRGLVYVLMNGATTPLVDANGTLGYDLLAGKVGDIPMEFIWFLVLAVVAWLLLNRHRLGQNAYVIGDNHQAAELMGIPIRRTRITLFVLTGLAAALCGLMNSLQVNNFFLSVGDGFFLPTLAAVFVGGTSVFGGRGTIYGTCLGAFMIGAIQAGIVAAGLSDFYTNACYGGVFLIAVTIHAVIRKRFQ